MRSVTLGPRDSPDRRVALRVALIYAVFGALWIVFSDRLLVLLVGDVKALTFIQTLKGCFYVLVTAALVYLLVQRSLAVLRHTQGLVQAGEQRYRQIVETASEGILTVNADEEAKITFVNARLAEMLGYAPQELLGRSVLEFMDEEWRQVAREKRRAKAHGPANRYDLKFRRRDGSELWALVSVNPLLSEQGEYVGALGMLADITERKRLEEQLRHSQKMEAVGQLAGGVSHDFNNILTAILGHVDLMRDALQRGLPTHALQENLDQIEHSGQRAAALTRQLLVFSRRQIILPEVLDLPRVVRGVEPMLRRLIREDVVLQIDCPADVWPICADAGQLEQVVVNLAVNARDAMPRGDRLTIAATNVTLDAEYVAHHSEAQPGSHVRLAVSDTGCGIEPAVLPRIFEPFFTTKPAGEGTGLGLATVHGIVKQLGGHILVDTGPNRGTTFNVYLPALGGVARPSPAAPAGVASPNGHETVLVCEDDETVRGLVCQALEAHGYTVLATTEPARALELAAGYDGPIHLLITDVIMTAMNGRQLARALQSQRPGMKVLFVSGYTSDVIAHQGVLDPGIEFLAKPFRSSDLLGRVREVLDRQPSNVAV